MTKKPHSKTLHPDILDQLETLTLDPHRPLIVSDADEVLLRFISQLECYLDKKGLWMDLNNYAISGNIKSKKTNHPVEVPNLIDDFFDHETTNIGAVENAAASINSLSQRAQIIILTNLPNIHKQRRSQNLRAHNMDYPVVIGSGLKGPPLGWFEAHMQAPIFFLDDIPHNIDSVAEHAPATSRIHFVADPRLAKLIGPAKGATVRIDNWNEAHDWINRQLDAAGF